VVTNANGGSRYHEESRFGFQIALNLAELGQWSTAHEADHSRYYSTDRHVVASRYVAATRLCQREPQRAFTDRLPSLKLKQWEGKEAWSIGSRKPGAMPMRPLRLD